MSTQSISKKLQELVSWSVATLGAAVEKEYGAATYKKVEDLRRKMKTIRGKDPDKVFKALKLELKKLETYKSSEVHRICYSFSLMLELINRCESAYRNFKLSGRDEVEFDSRPEKIIYVLTAHPTEARSPEFLELFNEVNEILEKYLYKKSEDLNAKLYHLLILSLKISLARNSKPSVADEADNIYSYILKDEILNSLISLGKRDIDVSFRTWVGGDKDGHPGVDEKTMLVSLNKSRKRLTQFVAEKLNITKKRIHLLSVEKHLKLELQLEKVMTQLKMLEEVREHDGLRVKEFKKEFDTLCMMYEKNFLILAPSLEDLKILIWNFPTLVVPLEVREDSELVHKALESETELAITKMLLKLNEISQGHEAKWYVRGFVLSMVQDHRDVEAGIKLTKKCLSGYHIPVVPLLENEKALTSGPSILENIFKKHKNIIKVHKKRWGSKYEVMVGYSDSSKENGVLPSRLMIAEGLRRIESTLKKEELKPVFFHGSGGSIERGGGSLQEQTSWWPKSALNIFKSTIQGEMVARSFATENIFEKQIQVISEQLKKSNVKRLPKDKTLNVFTQIVRGAYNKKIQDASFLKIIEAATPYSFLHLLRIGSRPSKRSKGSIQNNLRAIPWILCWTQTRTLFPTWWGVGSAWEKMNKEQKSSLKKSFKHHPVLVSYIKALGFTLAKIELGVWKLYLSSSSLSKKEQESVFNEFLLEYEKTNNFFQEITAGKDHLWFRPWLQESIDLRSSMIHPINLCQIESLRRKDDDLLRTSVTGVACGMLTTG